jgi:hypothetical protein
MDKGAPFAWRRARVVVHDGGGGADPRGNTYAHAWEHCSLLEPLSRGSNLGPTLGSF